MSFDRFFGMVYRGFQEQAPAGQLPDSVQMRGMLQEQFRQAQGAIAKVFPEYADLRCTEEGTFWLQPFDIASGRFGHGPEWIRFDDNGSATAVSFPDGFIVHRIDDDRVWGAMIDSMGVPSVAWVRVEG